MRALTIVMAMATTSTAGGCLDADEGAVADDVTATADSALPPECDGQKVSVAPLRLTTESNCHIAATHPRGAGVAVVTSVDIGERALTVTLTTQAQWATQVLPDTFDIHYEIGPCTGSDGNFEYLRYRLQGVSVGEVVGVLAYGEPELPPIIVPDLLFRPTAPGGGYTNGELFTEGGTSLDDIAAVMRASYAALDAGTEYVEVWDPAAPIVGE